MIAFSSGPSSHRGSDRGGRSVILLVVLVALFRPKDQAAAQAYAERLGQWVGPIAGTLMCFLAGRWVARAAQTRPVLHGSIVGLLSALIDIAILIASGMAFQWVFVVSNFVRLVGGMAASWRAAKLS